MMRRNGWGTLVAVVFLAACGDDTGPGVAIDDGVAPDAGTEMCTPIGATTGWTFARLGSGTKPALAVAADGAVHAAFINNALDGWTRYARLDAGSQAVSPLETIDGGYFYGPIDLVLNEDQPWVLFHDHTREDQVLAARAGADSWSLHPMSNSGHDGWYNTGTIDPDGRVLTATYDPAACSGVGVNYGVWDGSDWEVELAAPGRFDYAGEMALARANDGSVHIAFFDNLLREVKLATRTGGDWSVTTVESPDNALSIGLFPDMVVDPDGSTLHMVYLERVESSAGVVRYARVTPGAFEITDALDVSDFFIGQSGAQDLATLDLDGSGRPVIATQSRSELTVIRLSDGAAEAIANFTAADGISFGQQTEIEIDAQGRTHLVWWQSGGVPGTVCHAVSG